MMDKKKSDERSENEILMSQTNSGDDDSIVDKKTLKKYKVHWYNKIPYPVKALFIKYWFFGLVYFLFMNGLGSLPVFRNESSFTVMTLVLVLITGLAIGVFNDLLVYNILDVIEDFPGQKDLYVLYKSRKLVSLLINVFYGLVLGFLSLYLCALISSAIDPTLTSYWFREPFSAALVIFVLDAAFVGLKDLLARFVFRKGN